MIRVVMFDLGLTLIDSDRRPFPHCKEALAALANLKTADGEGLRSCLVSDFKMPSPPATEAKINALFNEYLEILDATRLRPFFEPVGARVTLSLHAGKTKPHREIFEKALQRLGADVSLEECLLITEEVAHIDAARDILKMQALQFGSDFDDWAAAPDLIASLLVPHQGAHAAIKSHLAAHGIDVLNAEPGKRSGAVNVSARVWSPISVPGNDDLQDIHMALPVEGEVTLGPKGEVRSVGSFKPSTDQINEATAYLETLANQGKIAGPSAKSARPEFQIETDEKGSRRLARRRMSFMKK